MPHRAILRTFVLLAAAVALLLAALPSTAYERPGRTERISAVQADGDESFGMSRFPDISADGRYVAFETTSALVPGDTKPWADAYVYDRTEGTVIRASLGDSEQEPNKLVGNVQISGNGRYVTFNSEANNLVQGDSNDRIDVFVRDLQEGTTQLVSIATDGTQGDQDSWFAASSSRDGRYIAFATMATSLVPGDTNGTMDVFLRDQVAGTTQRVSVSASGAQGNGWSGAVSLSATGRYVTFLSAATNLTEGLPGGGGILVKDLETGAIELVSKSTDGTSGTGSAGAPDISADGQRVVFISDASNLVPNDTNGAWDIFVRDRSTQTTARISVGTDGSERSRYFLGQPVISDSGRYVAHLDGGLNSLGGTDGVSDVVVHDLETHAYELASLSYDGNARNGFSWVPAISADGRYVAFESSVANLVPGDFNGNLDVFVRDRGPALGVGNVTATPTDNQVNVAGDGFFSGARLVTEADPATDGSSGAAGAGGELTGLDVYYQAEQEALLFQVRVASLPAPPAGPVRGGTGTVYTVTFTVGSQRYEIRGTWLGQSPVFALYSCAAVCAHTADLGGGHGSTGREVTIGLPLSAIGATDSSVLRAVRATTWLGVMAVGPLQAFDELAAPDFTIPPRSVQLALTPQGAAPDPSAFSQPVQIAAGRWTSQVPGATDDPQDLHARVCLGDTCNVSSLGVVGA